MQRVAIVTGGTRGIGAAISIALKEYGYNVIAFYNKNDQAARAFQHQHGIMVMRVDVADYNECESAINEINEKYGIPTILINNAGITRDGLMHKITPVEWHDVISTNLTSCFNMCHSVIHGMIHEKYGRIINISSINALKGQRGQVNYSAAKAGVLGLTRSLALEVAHKGITVNAIAPGYVDTEMVRAVAPEILESIIKQIPVGRLGHPHEIANMVTFLCAENAGFITGSTFNLNGGQFLN